MGTYLKFAKKALVFGCVGVVAFVVLFLLWFRYDRLLFVNKTFSSSDSAFLQMGQKSLVKWNQFNKEAVLDAQSKNQLLFFFIGNKGCTYCEFSLREISTSPFVASLLNRHYRSFLIDKHQWPLLVQQLKEVSNYQLDEVVWPLVLIATPDGIPLFIAKAKNKSNVLKPLSLVLADWRKQSQKTQLDASGYARQFQQYLIKRNLNFQANVNSFLDMDLSPMFDKTLGGFSKPIRFPYLRQLNYLITYFGAYEPHVEFTLSRLITSPMFDFVDGGIFQLSSTNDWLTPVFDKLLVDQVFLLDLFASMYERSKQSIYRDYIEFNLSFIFDNYQSAQGGFYTNYKVPFKSNYYTVNADFLNFHSPHNFGQVNYQFNERIPVLMSLNDLNGVSRKLLKNYRKTIKSQPVIVKEIIVQDNMQLFKTLLRLKSLKVNIDNTVFASLKAYLYSLDVDQLQLDELLLFYDIATDLNDSMKLLQLKEKILLMIDSPPPFYNSLSYFNQDIYRPQLTDHLHHPHFIHYLLKYRSEFLSDIPTHTLCANLKPYFVLPFDQLSLLNFYQHTCR